LVCQGPSTSEESAMNAVEMLDELIAGLDAGLKGRPAAGDAIEEILSSPDRQTAVRSLRDSEVMVRFRQELTDGLIRVDTAAKVLDVVRRAIAVLVQG